MSLIARYKLEDSATLTTDETGNSNTLTNNNVSIVTDPTYGTVASFNAASASYLVLPSAPSAITASSSRTYSVWVKPGGSSFRIIQGQGNDNTSEYRVQLDGSNQLTAARQNATSVAPTGIVSGQWSHIAMTYDGTTERMYINDSLEREVAVALTTSTGPLWIGGSPRYNGSFTLTGDMLDFRIYDDALSAADITTLHTAGPNVMPIVVEWVLDANSMYEVSSKEHLIQIMNDGAIYQNSGSVPTPNNNQWGRANYIQTADIDLEGDSTNIRSLGYTSNWAGIYDGNGYTISNWAYVESNFPGASTEHSYGLFGVINGGTVKNVRLAGVCTLSGFKDGGGMISSRVLRNCVISNIEVDLSPGSYITQSNSETTEAHMAPVFARLDHSGTVTGVTFKGVMDSMTPSTSAPTVSMGGIVGYMRFCTGTNTLFRNFGTFPSGLSGTRVGGIAGYIHVSSNLNKVLNAMTGHISGTYAGGVYGLMASPGTCYEFINSMKGNITADATNSHAGGIGGQGSGSAMHSFMNYMAGDILNTNSAGRAEGLIGQGVSTTDIATSINAMNGTVFAAIMGNPLSSPTVATVNTSFGLEFTSSNHSTADPVTGLPTDPGTGLRVVDLSATDPGGVTYTFDFVFGNLPPTYNQLQIKGANDFFNMSELEIYDLGGTNIALLGTASTDVPGGNPQATRGNDGNTAHDFASGTVMDLYLSGGPTWILDLDRAYTLSEINKVVFYNRSGTVEPARAIGSVVTFYSADGDSEQVGVLGSELIQDFTITQVTPAPTTDPGLIKNGAVMYVNAGEVGSWVDGASAMNDLSGSSVVFDFKAGVTAPSQSERGVDFTPANNSLKLSSAISVQTISLWLKKVDFNGVTLIDLRELNNGVVGEPAQVENGNGIGTFFTGGAVYLDGSPSTLAAVDSVPNDTFINVVFVGAHLSAATRLTLFANFGQNYTYPTIFRGALFYDRALSAEEILENYNTLALRPQAGFAFVPPLALTPRPLSVRVVVGPQPGATAYRLTSQTASSTEGIVKNGFTYLEQTIRDLSPDTEYTFRLYSTSGQGYSLVDTLTVTTLENSAGSYDVNDFGGSGQFDLSSLGTTSVRLISDVMNELFTTGDEIELSVSGARGTKKSKFVNRGGSVSITDSEALVAPFSTDAGPGQAVSLTLSDSSTVAVSYDETTEAVTVGATSYVPGDSFILDGKKTTIVDI